MKKLVKTLLIIIVLGICLYQISLFTQNRNFNRYGVDFNDNRKNIGLSKLPQDWKFEKHTWDHWNDLSNDHYLDNSFSKFLKIYSLSDIQTGIVYTVDSIQTDAIFQSKVIWFNSNILFWKNTISSEMDVYRKTMDSTSTEILYVRYYFKDDNDNKDYFEAHFQHINENDFRFCSTPVVIEREEQRISGKPYFGNITKKQADSILAIWNK